MAASESNAAPTKVQSELIAFLFDSQAHAIRAALTAWVVSSPRYAAFAEKYKDKIRKKLRVTREQDAIADLLVELQIPHWLLQERRFEVAYEPYGIGKTTSPDYSVTFRTNFTFNIEVTHVRRLQAGLPAPGVDNAIDFRLVDVLCGKLRQTVANMANLLCVVAAPGLPAALDVAAHIAWIKDKAESRDAQFYQRHRYAGPSDFFKVYERLSGLTLYDSAAVGAHVVWLNPQSRVALPNPVRNILQRGLAV